MQKDNIKNMNHPDVNNITKNDNSSIIINGDRSVSDFMGIIKRDREWREVEPQQKTPTVYKDNVIKFPITSNVVILTPVPPKNIA
jgi:hypothetical protein